MRRLFAIMLATIAASAAMAQITPSPDMINRISLQTLSDPAIQREIKFTDQQKQSLARLQKVFQDEMAERNREAIDLSLQERLAMINELSYYMDIEVRKMLNKPQITRLSQIRMQAQGAFALGITEVQVALQLSKEQREQINGLISAYTIEQEELFKKVQAGEAKIMTSEERTTRRAKLDNDLLSVLTPSQVTAYTKLQGTPYIDGTKKTLPASKPKP
ncbi:MAG: hypothetical protein ACYC1M_09460 [Armatimonadota bacterium]